MFESVHLNGYPVILDNTEEANWNVKAIAIEIYLFIFPTSVHPALALIGAVYRG